MRPIETNGMEIQWRTWVFGGAVNLYYNNYHAQRPTIYWTLYYPYPRGQTYGRFTLIRTGGGFVYIPTSTTLSAGADLLPYFQFTLSDPSTQGAIQSFTLDETGLNAILVTRPIAD